MEFSFPNYVRSKRLEQLRTSRSALVEYLQFCGNEFNRQVMAAGPWDCSAREQCRCRATGTVLTPMSYLSRDPPFIWQSFVVLKCDDPLCEIAAKQETKHFIKDASNKWDNACMENGREKRLYSGKGRLCESCGAQDCDKALMQCARCSVAYYCSKDCQVRHWKEHKPRCLPTRPPPALASSRPADA